MSSLDFMLGMTFESVVNENNDELVFTRGDGYKVTFYHSQDCCEYVRIEDVCGDLSDLEGAPLLVADESSSDAEDIESGTWTFYRFSTIKGSVTVRWLGESNGYYSEEVNYRIDEAKS